MRYALVATSVLCVAVVACSDDAANTLGGPETAADAPGTEPARDATADAGEQARPTEDDSPAEGEGEDAGADADASVDAGPPPNAFSGAPAYVATLGPSARKNAHNFGQNGSPAGRACLNCHDGDGRAPEFAFGGTVYRDAAGAQAAARVEVRVRDQNGKAVSAYSDNDGNFFFPLNPNGDLAFPAHAGIRNASGTKLMGSTVNNGNCNACHNAGAAGRLVAP
jgi:hypothetical protein